MRGPYSLRRVCLQVVLLLLAVSVFALATESKISEYHPAHHITTLCKATDGSARLKFWPAPPMSCAPARLEVPALHAEAVALPPEVSGPDPESFSTANPLRAPPAQ